MTLTLPNLSRRQLLVAGAGAAGALSLPIAAHAQGAVVQSPSPANCTPVRPGTNLPVQQIEKIMQTGGHMLDNNVLLITLVRKDLTVTGPNGHPFKPAFAPNHKFFFEPLANGEALMNAEFTFIPSEHHATMDAILGSMLDIMAEHQHYIGESPQTFHYHFRGRGNPTDIAQAAMKVVRATGTPLPQHPPANPTTTLPIDQMSQILGSGKPIIAAGGVALFSIPRHDKWQFLEDGAMMVPQTNLLHKISFEPLNGSAGANVGADFIMLPGEINPALKKANQLGFGIHCLYNQQIQIQPNPFFSHCLKAGDPVQLAKNVKAVIDVISSTQRASAACQQSNAG